MRAKVLLNADTALLKSGKTTMELKAFYAVFVVAADNDLFYTGNGQIKKAFPFKSQ